MNGEDWIGPTWAIKNIRLEKDPDKKDCYIMKADITASSKEEVAEVEAYFEAVIQSVVASVKADFERMEVKK